MTGATMGNPQTLGRLFGYPEMIISGYLFPRLSRRSAGQGKFTARRNALFG